jgi:symplekin
LTIQQRPEQNETSLALVPRDHPVIPPSNLEAEASGLLDRLLGVLQENSRSDNLVIVSKNSTDMTCSDALIVTATINSLATLCRHRPSIANKIISTTLTFNPLSLAASPMTPKNKVMIRSMSRTTMSFLTNLIKKYAGSLRAQNHPLTIARQPNHPMLARIQQYIERVRHSIIEAFDETSRKRPAPSEPTDGLSDSKRQRIGAEVSSPTTTNGLPSYPPLPSGPLSYKQLFTLTQDPGASNFDVKALPVDLVQKIVPALLSSIDRTRLDHALNVRSNSWCIFMTID